MHAKWWESPTCWLCDYWWILLILLALCLTGYFSREQWLPYVLPPTATPTVTPSPTLTSTITSTITPTLTQTPRPPQGLSDVDVSQVDIVISVRDDKKVDGDIIDLEINGELLLSDFRLDGSAHQLNVVLEPGENSVTITAKNQGDVGQNTVEVSVSHVIRGDPIQISSGLDTGDTESFTIWAPESSP